MTMVSAERAKGMGARPAELTIEADALQRYEYSFRLSLELWRRYRGPDDLRWECVPFRRSDWESIPKYPGVYAFCVRPMIGGNLCGSYVLYVGKTDRSLRTRCREYLRNIEADRERPKLLRMLRLFSGSDHLQFCYAVVTESSPTSIEKFLLEATVPPACTTFPASV